MLMLRPASQRDAMAQKVSEVCHEFLVWLQEYRVRFIAFRMATHLVEFLFFFLFLFFEGICLLQFLTHLWLLFLIM